MSTTRTAVQSVYLTAAQRVSVLVTAKNTTDTNYYMHADMDTDMFDVLPEDLDHSKQTTIFNTKQIILYTHLLLDLTAPIYYDQSHNNFAPSNDSGEKTAFDDLRLSPLIPKAAVEPDHQVNLTIDFQVTTDGINRGMFNGLPYLAPKVPTINTLFSEGQDALSSTVYGPQTRAIVLDHMDMVELVLNNLDAGDHPCKLHTACQ